MLKIVVLVLAVLIVGFLGVAYFYGFIFNPSPTDPPKEKSIYEFTMNDIDGNIVKFETFKNKVVLVVNVASKCGLTPQYDQLEPLYKKYKEQGFVILGFPANNFLGQEPGTESEIKEFCKLKYDVSFPMFSKLSVKGKDQHPFFTFLTNEKSNPGFGGDISWNFEKFLIGKDGKTLARFNPRTVPNDQSVIDAIEKALK